jgi:indole-3-glycerol phosphate synthase
MKTDLATTERLASMVPADRILVSESGIESPVDIKRMADAGAKAFLVGEALMRRQDLEVATRVMLTGFAAAGKAN